eukprot:5697114-Alexandrium_andersonii.AAC.1
MPPRRRKPERVLRWDIIPESRRSGQDVQPSSVNPKYETRWRNQRPPRGGPCQRGHQEGPPPQSSGGPWPTMGFPP